MPAQTDILHLSSPQLTDACSRFKQMETAQQPSGLWRLLGTKLAHTLNPEGVDTLEAKQLLIILATVDTSEALSTKPEYAKAGHKQWPLSAVIPHQTYWFMLQYVPHCDEITQQKFITHYELDIAQLITYTLTHKTEAEHWLSENPQAIFAIYFKYASLKNRELIAAIIWEQVDNLPVKLDSQIAPLFLADPNIFLSTIDTNLTDLPIKALSSRYQKLLVIKQQLQPAVASEIMLKIDEKLAILGVRIYRFYLEHRDQNHFRSIFPSLAALHQSEQYSCAMLTTYMLIHHAIKTDKADAAMRAIDYIKQFDPLNQTNTEYLFLNHGRLPHFTVIELSRLYDELLKRPLEQNIELYRQVVTFILKESTWIDQIAEANKLREKIAYTYFYVLGTKQCTLDKNLAGQLLRFASKNEGSCDTAWAAVAHNPSLREKFTPSDVFTLAQQTNNAVAASVVLEYYYPLLREKEDVEFIVDFVQHFNQPTIADAAFAQLLGASYPKTLAPIYIVTAFENAALLRLPIDDRHLHYLLLKTLQIREFEFPHPILYEILEKLVAHPNHLLLDDFLYACPPDRLLHLYHSNFTGACDLIVQTPKLFQFLFAQKPSLTTLQSMLIHAPANSQQREQVVQHIMTLSPNAFDGQHDTVINDIARRYPTETLKALSPDMPKETLLLLFRQKGSYQTRIETRYELRSIVESLLTTAEAMALLHPDDPSPPRSYREWARLARQAAHSTSALSDGSQDESSIEGSALAHSRSAPELRLLLPSIPIQKLVPGDKSLVLDLRHAIEPWVTLCQIAAEQTKTDDRCIQEPEADMIRTLLDFPMNHFPQTIQIAAGMVTITVSITCGDSIKTETAVCWAIHNEKFQTAIELLAELCATTTDLSVILETGGTPWIELLLYGSSNQSVHAALFNHLAETQKLQNLSADAFQKMLKIIGFSSHRLIDLLQDKKFATHRRPLIEFILLHHASTLTMKELQTTLRTLQPDDFAQPEFLNALATNDNIPTAELIKLIASMNPLYKASFALHILQNTTRLSQCTETELQKLIQTLDEQTTQQLLQWLPDNLPQDETTDCSGSAQLATVWVKQDATHLPQLLPLCLAEPSTAHDLLVTLHTETELLSRTFERLLDQLDITQRTKAIQQLLIKSNDHPSHDGLRHYAMNYLASKPHHVNLTAFQQNTLCNDVLRQLFKNTFFLEQLMKTPAEGTPSQYTILSQFPIEHIISDDAILQTLSRYPRLLIDLVTAHQTNMDDALSYCAHARTNPIAQLTHPAGAHIYQIFAQLLKHVAFDNFYCEMLPAFADEKKVQLIILYLNQRATTLSSEQIIPLLRKIISIRSALATPLYVFNKICVNLSKPASQAVAHQLLKDPAYVRSIKLDKNLAQLIRQYAPTVDSLPPLIDDYSRFEVAPEQSVDPAQFSIQRSRLARIMLKKYDILFSQLYRPQRNILLNRLGDIDIKLLIADFANQLLTSHGRAGNIDAILHILSQHPDVKKHLRKSIIASTKQPTNKALAYLILRYCQLDIHEIAELLQTPRQNIIQRLIDVIDNNIYLTLIYNSNDFETKKYAKLKLEKSRTTLADHQTNINKLREMIYHPEKYSHDQAGETEKITEACAKQFLEQTLHHLQNPQVCWAALVPADTTPLQMLNFLQIILHPAIATRLMPLAQTYLKEQEQEALNHLHADKNPISRWWAKLKHNVSQWWARTFYSDIEHPGLRKTLATISSTQAATIASLGHITARPAPLPDEGSVNTSPADQTADKCAAATATPPQSTTQPDPRHVWGLRPTRT